MRPIVEAFFDKPTNTVTYVVVEPNGAHCAVIDSVLDYDPKSGRTNTKAADQVIAFVQENQLKIDWIIETHVHADHLTAAPYLKQTLGGKTGIGEHITDVQEIFSKIFNVGADFICDGSQFDQLFSDGETIMVGDMPIRVMHTPGHTPACLTYIAGDAAFVGDTLFMPDYGTARADFPGGDPATLYRSIQNIFELPDKSRLYMCHDYLTQDRKKYAWETTVAEERNNNVHVGQGVTEREFVAMRNARDKTLDVPNLILPSVQVNMRAGHLPPAENDGISYLKIPVNVL